MNKIKYLAALLPLCACASIIDGSSQAIHLTTTPANAQCQAHNSQGTFTPTGQTLIVHKDNTNLFIDCTKGNLYAHEEFKYTRSNSVYANALAGGTIGLIIDDNTGASWEYPTDIHINLK